MPPIFRPSDSSYVVLDEAQAIKNAASASAKAARLLKADHRLALSGTPVENHLGELWSLFEFLNPGLLGAAPVFERAAAGRNLDEAAVATLARGLASVHPAPDEGSGGSGAAGQDRADAVLRARAAAASALRRAARSLSAHAARSRQRRAARARQAAGARGAAPPAAGGVSSRADRCEPQEGCVGQARRADPSHRAVRRGGPQDARVLAVHQPAGDRARAARCRPRHLRISRRPDPRPRGEGGPVPDGSRLPPVPCQPEGRRRRPEPHRGGVRVPARSLVEPGRRSAGDRSDASHRPDTARVCLPADRPRHGRGARTRAAAAQAIAGGRDPLSRRRPDPRPPARRPGTAVV